MMQRHVSGTAFVLQKIFSGDRKHFPPLLLFLLANNQFVVRVHVALDQAHDQFDHWLFPFDFQ